MSSTGSPSGDAASGALVPCSPVGQPGLPPAQAYPQPQPPVYVVPYANPYAAAAPVDRGGNGFAVAAFVLGLWGFLVTWIPFFIGLILGGLPNLLAVIFGIIGIVRANRVGPGMGLAIAGLVLGGLAGISIFFGAGWIW